MPFVTIKVLEGKTTEEKSKMVEKMTDLISNEWKVPKELIYIFFDDLKQENYGKQGKLYSK